MALQPVISHHISLPDFATPQSIPPSATVKMSSQATKVPHARRVTAEPATGSPIEAATVEPALEVSVTRSLYRSSTAAPPSARTTTVKPRYRPRKGVVLGTLWI